MNDGDVHYSCQGPVATVVFDRPAARNAMTWHMYQRLADICGQIRDNAELRVAVLRGAGGKAFIAGTDIAQFLAFKTGEDGIAYEAMMEGYIAALEALPIPTLAVVEGWAIGGGLAIAAACDLRIATPGSRFGVPIARTLGNCLSVANIARLVAGLGAARTKRMMLMAENILAEELVAAGFVAEIVAPDALDARTKAICDQLVSHAPVTMRVSKEAVRRVVAAGIGNGDDLVRAAYGSDDFHDGVRAFVDKRAACWRGQ
jgi:enoyl-CoA hydratase/carnithine racemase